MHYGDIESQVIEGIHALEKDRILSRIWQKDFTVWHPSPDEITNRLDWLDSPREMNEEIERITNFVERVRQEGYQRVLLLGMGGSSLAPEVFRKTFGVKAGYLDLAVLDSTDPGAVGLYADSIDLANTLFIVATKSGSTVETLSFFKFFYNLSMEKFGLVGAGRHFIAITDPNSQLVDLAEKYQFRAILQNNPNIGGRYSALSFFGLVPAALIGADISKLLKRAKRAASMNDANTPASKSSAAILGAAIAIAAQSGRDKLTFISDPQIANFEDWVEQLIAESTGKSGTGIVPVVREPHPADFKSYSKDRMFIITALGGHHSGNFGLLKELGHPVLHLNLADVYDLGALIFTWELATCIAGHILHIHPFNQPNVESSKASARAMVKAYRRKGKLPEGNTIPLSSVDLKEFLKDSRPGDYIAIQAYVTPSQTTTNALRTLQTTLRDKYRLAVTVGYGPRFLHSTGQLHKGDSGKGLFLQIVSTSGADTPIPETPGEDQSFISFDVLKQAQAMGDAQALRSANRRVLSLNITQPPDRELEELADSLK